MIKIVRTKALAALREDAARLPRLHRQIAESRREAEAASAEATRLAAALDAAVAEVRGKLARLLAAVRDPATGPSVQADITLHLVRDMIAEVKASGDAAAIKGIRVIDALLGKDLPFPSSSTRPAASLSTASCEPGSSPQHAPGGAHR
jgi:hypothetical protein